MHVKEDKTMEDGFLTCLRESITSVQRALLDTGDQIEKLIGLNLPPKNLDAITNKDLRWLHNLLVVCEKHYKKLAAFEDCCTLDFGEEE